ncbi:MAG: protein kinase [Fibrobacteria bacterium]|nr:protein kinase [Fibrobacteria bacterium]
MTTAIEYLSPGSPGTIKHPEDFIGKRFGKCVIQGKLKEGGQGCSFLAWDNEVKKERVIKISKHPAGDDDDKPENLSFKNEGIILARLRHPQIVDMIEQGNAFGYHYMIIDFIHGYDFNRIMRILRGKQEEFHVKWHKLLNPVTALAITASALEPLAYAHTTKIQLPGEGIVEGLAHRDISAGNLMLGFGHEYEGLIHMIDFGMAKSNLHYSQTPDTNIMGTIRYVSPMRLMLKKRQGKGSEFWKDFKQTQYDVHSMGCFLYELLFGNTHIDFPDIHKCLSAINSPDTYKKLYKDVKGLNHRIREIIHHSIVMPNLKKPSSQYQYRNAAEMRDVVVSAFNKLSGGMDIGECLRQFSSVIERPEEIVKQVDGKTSKLIMYPTSAVAAPAPTKRRNIPLIISTLALLSITGLVLAWLFINGIPSTIPGKAHTPEPPNKAITSTKETTTAGKPTNRNTLTRKKAIPTVNQNRSDSRLRAEFDILQEQLRSGNINLAYKKVSILLNTYKDPALYIIKADLIKRRSPTSPKIQRLLQKASTGSSILMDKATLKAKISTLSK